MCRLNPEEKVSFSIHFLIFFLINKLNSANMAYIPSYPYMYIVKTNTV